MLQAAEQANRGVGAFNIHCLEVVPAMIRAGANLHQPIILQVSVSTAKYIGMKLLRMVTEQLASETETEVALHLDHASQLEDVYMALDAGFTSVMFDGSRLPLEENIQLTAQAVAAALQVNASVEAELGIVGRGSTPEVFPYTDPEAAEEFVNRTGVNALAVAIGTYHGQYKRKTDIRFDVLEQIHKRVDIPLVLHGGTGVREEELQRCIHLGMRKLNFGTELNVAFVRKGKEAFAAAEPDLSLRKIMDPCCEAVEEVVSRKIKLVGFNP